MFLRGRAGDAAAGCLTEDADMKGNAGRIGAGVGELTVFRACEGAVGHRVPAEKATDGFFVPFFLPRLLLLFGNDRKKRRILPHVKAAGVRNIATGRV